MNITTYLKTRKTPLTKLLPRKGLNDLAQKHQLNTQVISRMLRGLGDEYKYSEDSIKSVFLSALKLIRQQAECNIQEVKTLEEQFNHLVAA